MLINHYVMHRLAGNHPAGLLLLAAMPGEYRACGKRANAQQEACQATEHAASLASKSESIASTISVLQGLPLWCGELLQTGCK